MQKTRPLSGLERSDTNDAIIFMSCHTCGAPRNSTKSVSLRQVQEDRIDKRFIKMNERIRAREIRVIGPEGEQLGIMTPHGCDQKGP